MLQPGRLPLNAAEHAAVDSLLEQHPGQPISLTRRDPGETGPLLVHVGDDTYQLDKRGRRRKAND